MKRLIVVEPPVGAALWCRRLAVLGLLLAAVAVLASRAERVDPPGGVAILGAALALALLALPLALVAAVVIWRTGRPGFGAMLAGTVLACLLLAFPASVAVKAFHQPLLNDVSTDPADPLPFSQSPGALAARRGAVHDPPPEAERRRQASAYPDVRPLTLDASPADVHQAVLRLVRGRRWVVVEAQAPTGRSAVGRVEAVAKTSVMAFPEDVAIRIAASGTSQTRVDMRSTSRFGGGDLGTNAARVQSFLSDLEDEADQN